MCELPTTFNGSLHLNMEQYYFECIQKGINLYWHSLGKARNLECHQGDIEYLISNPKGGPERIFNIQLSSDTAEQRIDEIIAGIKARNLPESLLITPKSTPANLVDILIKKGFKIDDSSPCMAMDLTGCKLITNSKDEIRVIAVENLDNLRYWIDIVNTALFECEIMTFEQFYDIYCLNNTRFFIALYNNTPAAVSMVITENDIATLEFVASLKEYRNKGLGTAVTTEALKYLQDKNIKIVSLRSEPAAINIYKKVGFQEFCKRILATYDL